MSRRHSRVSRRKCVVALAAVILIAPVATAQDQMNLRTVTRFQLKPDRVGDFRSVIKDINAVLKKAGHNRSATWWQSQSGPREMALVSYWAKWSELGTPPAAFKEAAADLAPLLARLSQCSDQVERIIEQVMPDHGLPPADVIPTLVQVNRLVVKPERVEEYLALRKAEFLPALKKSGVTTAIFTHTRYGGPRNEFRNAVGLKDWADLDGPPKLVEAFGGAAAYQKYLEKVRPMLVETEYNLYVHQPELSYLVQR